MSTRGFQLQATVHENVAELRRVLGSVAKPLSLRDFAALVDVKHPLRKIDYKMIERWEGAVEPDIVSTAIMAEMAGVGFEPFALGKRYMITDAATGESAVVDATLQVAESKPRWMTIAEAAGAKPVSDQPYRDRAAEIAAKNEAVAPKRKTSGKKKSR